MQRGWQDRQPTLPTRPLVSLGSSFSCQSACFRIHLVGRTVDQATKIRHLLLLDLLFPARLHAILIHLGWQDRQLRLHAAWLAGPPAHAFPFDLGFLLALPFLVRVHALRPQDRGWPPISFFLASFPNSFQNLLVWIVGFRYSVHILQTALLSGLASLRTKDRFQFKFLCTRHEFISELARMDTWVS
jgi:hypothetical protein